MNKKNGDLLHNKFPLLYHEKQYYSHDDGWFAIIYHLSARLEPLIEEWLAEHPDKECQCMCPKNKHAVLNIHGQETRLGCSKIYIVPYRLTISYGYPYRYVFSNIFDRIQYKVRFGGWKIKCKINQILRYFASKFKIGPRKPCLCPQYYSNHPRAVQIKEKYGTLRFYMSSTPKNMQQHIDNAELLTATTCEACGAPGILRSGGWVRTLCDTHAQSTPPYNA